MSAILVLALGTGAWWAAEALVVSRTVSEGRTVADMAENVGRWASQYGGVHVRTEGTKAALPGTFLTRSVYAVSGDDAAFLQGAKATDKADAKPSEKEVMQRVEAYHWKNPALIQRELADVLLAAGSKAQYRLTARTVLNESNAPNAFELEALTAMQASAERQTAASAARVAVHQPANQATAQAAGEPLEYWKVEGGRLLYARAVVAQKSCLKCHDSAAKAPEFLRVNNQFNGGGGFGYVAGKPAGVISVTVPVPDTYTLLSDGLPGKAWLAFAGAAVAGLGVVGLTLAGMFKRRATDGAKPGAPRSGFPSAPGTGPGAGASRPMPL
ncbi:MAG TPA: DUF3365 domain-containing protein [Candidatus Aquabacterium excrementipullorum]|nr:DUF3365 domain-containing protein [Candidatus Aquabacterium excrementipullorum]